MPELRRTGGVPFLPGIHRSRILPRMSVLPQRLVYEEGARSENGGSLLWKFDLGRLRWAHHRGDHEQYGWHAGIESVALGVHNRGKHRTRRAGCLEC